MGSIEVGIEEDDPFLYSCLERRSISVNGQTVELVSLSTPAWDGKDEA